MTAKAPALPAKPPPDPAAVEQVLKWVIAGHGEADIIGAMAKEYPGADAPGSILAAMVRLQQAADAEPAVIQGWCLEATRDLYRRMAEAGDFAGALRAVKMLSDLVRGYVPNRPDDSTSAPRLAESEADGEGREVPDKEKPRGGKKRRRKPGKPRVRPAAGRGEPEPEA